MPTKSYSFARLHHILGIAENNRNEEINEILNACNDRTLRKDDIGSWLLIQEVLKKDNGLITTQIELLIGNRNISELASGGISKSFSSEEWISEKILTGWLLFVSTVASVTWYPFL